jgi:hypothetical protein
MTEEQDIKVRKTHGVGAPSALAFRHLPAGPERDCAREFYELWEDLSWLRDGPKKDLFLTSLLVAREAAMRIAESMVR